MITDVMDNPPRTLWEGRFWGGSEQTIIGYGDFVSGRPGKQTDWFMVGLALQKNYISLYVNAVQNGQYVAEQYRSQLGRVKVGKASISFNRLDDINLDGLAAVLRIARDQLARQPQV
ncbi:MAG: hypothetical protein AB2L09_08265 [Coriobacteriia bacterium]